MDFPNLDLLESAAQKLRPLLPEIVFVGGCATGLLISDPGAAPVSRTYDVDVISEIVSYADYAAFSERLRALGFTEDSREGAPLCRWQHGELALDVMPLDASILGFSNRWYADALRTAVGVELPSGLKAQGHHRAVLPRHQDRSVPWPRPCGLLRQSRPRRLHNGYRRTPVAAARGWGSITRSLRVPCRGRARASLCVTIS